ncbi:unnamed protein product, partial [Rotaria sp. Silwood1]
MSNSDVNNSRLTSMNTNSSSSSIINSTPTSPSTSSICSTSTSSLSITPRRIVKAKRSLVWRYFKDMKDDVLNVECVLCSSVITRKSTSTSNLLHHIQTQHNVEYQHLNKVMKSQTQTSDSTTRLPLTSDRSIHLTKLIADLIIYNFLPLSIVESPHLQAILAETEPSYIIPRRKYFTNNVLQEMYNEVQQKAYEELQQAPGICLTTDIWTSQANQAYMTITAHFIENRTAERIVERLESICDKWSISDKIICLVSDTCPTMRKVGVEFGKGWIGCTDYLVNLSVNDIIRKQDEVINMLSTIRYIVTYTRDSHLANEMLNKYQRSFGFIERQLIFDVITRWNSTLYMLQRFIEEKICVAACLNEKLFQKHFTNAKVSKVIDWDVLEQLMVILEPFEAATRKLASDSSPTLSIVLPVVTTLITSLEDRSTDSSFIKKIKDAFRGSIQERFKEIYENKLVLLDPRWKDFTFLQRPSYQNHVETLSLLNKLQAFEAKQLAYLYLQEQYNSLLGNNLAVPPVNTQQNEEKEKEFDLFDIMITNRNNTSSNNRDSELLIYENEREIHRNESPLEWWYANQTKYPILSQLADKYLCISGTSVPSERMFSAT